MTNEELKQLNQIKSDIDELTRSFGIINQGTTEGRNQISIKIYGHDHVPQVQRVPGLSDQLRYMALEMIGDRIDELESKLNSLVLCTQAIGGPVYTPADLTNGTEKNM